MTNNIALGLLIIRLAMTQGLDQYQVPFSNAILSSIFESNTADRAIDGNLQTYAHSTCNYQGKEMWLKLWLKWPAWIDHFVIYPTHVGVDAYTRFQGARVYVEDQSGVEVLCGTLALDVVSSSHTIKCSGSVDNFVEVVMIRLQKASYMCIQMKEIKAFGDYRKYYYYSIKYA